MHIGTKCKRKKKKITIEHSRHSPNLLLTINKKKKKIHLKQHYPRRMVALSFLPISWSQHLVQPLTSGTQEALVRKIVYITRLENLLLGKKKKGRNKIQKHNREFIAGNPITPSPKRARNLLSTNMVNQSQNLPKGTRKTKHLKYYNASIKVNVMCSPWIQAHSEQNI